MGRYRKVKDAAGRMGYARQVPFTYVTNITTSALADGLTATGSFQVDTGLPFILTEMGCANDTDTATLTTLQNLLFSVLDGETQQLFSNGPVPRERMFGTRDFPRQLPSEVELSPADTITITMTNKTGAALTSITRITFTGYKLVGFSPQPSE
jgi:hypothetical protein